MNDMTPEGALALRKPFPPETIGKLPKPVKSGDNDKGKCEKGSKYSADGEFCGGWHSRSVHLDFAGHAATTDRLLTVDPMWSWEPLAVGPDGLPAHDREGNLWIKLTICGVTRLGVGDGKSAKERIGDAIRNAAMRFGVALDLWAKEDLVEFAHAAAARKGQPASLAEAVAAGTNSDADDEWTDRIADCHTHADARRLWAEAKHDGAPQHILDAISAHGAELKAEAHGTIKPQSLSDAIGAQS